MDSLGGFAGITPAAERYLGMGADLQARELLTAATAAEEDSTALPEVLLVYAHPDDEVIALGGRMRRFGSAHMVHVTDGAPLNGQDSRAHGFADIEGYREARAAELSEVLGAAGVEGMSRECLGISDQEAAHRLHELTVRLVEVLEERNPQVVFTHPYEGGHPDHDACAFAVHTAVRMRVRMGREAPLIVESPFYHRGAGAGGMETGEFLAGTQSDADLSYELNSEERRQKERLLLCYRTQREVLASFGVDRERYRVAPAYNFGERPNEGPGWYDSFDWGMDSGQFCRLARETENALFTDAGRLCA